jgi:hypothetical protein
VRQQRSRAFDFGDQFFQHHRGLAAAVAVAVRLGGGLDCREVTRPGIGQRLVRSGQYCGEAGDGRSGASGEHAA